MNIDLGKFHELIKQGVVTEIELDHNKDLFDILKIGAKTAWQIDSDHELNGLVAFAGEDYDDITYIGPPELEHQVQAWIDWELFHNHDDS